ncbi:MAG: hypothetical protein NTW67_06410 [Candidatus Woesearchaeota archaeon]|nr:hypothetical protein [Candidatus Woesearchaeota archaeon]
MADLSQIVNENVRLFHLLVSDLHNLEDKNKSGIIAQYESRLDQILDSAKVDLRMIDFAELRVQDLSASLLGLIAENKSARDNTVADYARDVDRLLFDKYFPQFSGLVEKYLAELSNLQKSVLDKEGVQKANNFLQVHRKEYKKAFNSKNRDELQEYVVQKYEEYRRSVQNNESAQRRLKNSNMLIIPVRLHYRSDGVVVVTDPVLKNPSEELMSHYVSSDIRDVVTERLKRTGFVPHFIETWESGDFAVAPVESKPSIESITKVEAPESDFKYSIKDLARELGVASFRVNDYVRRKHPELLEQSKLVPEGRKNVFTRLYTQNVLDQLKESIAPKQRDFRGVLDEKSVQITNLLEKGKSDSYVAKQFGISPSTISHFKESVGMWSSRYLKANYPTLDDVALKTMPGVVSYPKDDIREQMILKSIDCLILKSIDCLKEEINYLGLEGAHFGSYILLNDFFNVNPAKSLVAENNPLEYKIMRSIVDNWKVFKPGKLHSKDGSIFNGLNVYEGNLGDAVRDFSKSNECKWNLINLDYTGCINDEKVKTLELLFDSKLIADNALMFVTLNDDEQMRERVRTGNGLNGCTPSTGYGTSDQMAVVDACLKRFSERNDYFVERINDVSYSCKERPMLALAYRVIHGHTVRVQNEKCGVVAKNE